jgi:O-antigen/teichoic acid export membrane protein
MLDQLCKHALGWNTLLYGIHKSSSTLLTFVLYHHLPAEQFALWAITNSVIFLALIWTDFGFKKSVLRFFPELKAERRLYLQRLSLIGLVRILLLLGTTPIIYYMIQHYNKNALPFWIIVGIYTTEGTIQFLQSVYHAQFLHKNFNLFRALFLILETGISFCVLLSQQQDPLFFIFYTKVCSSIICSIGLLGLLFCSKPVLKEAYCTVALPFCWSLFVRHASIMWITGMCKSFSERNIVIPLIAATLGPKQAGLCKVAQDGALFFQRTIIKTFGSTAISYLSYSSSDETVMVRSLEKLCKMTIALSIPLALIVLCIGSVVYRSSQPMLLELFLIFLFFYLIELLFFGYETFLEVNYYYKALLYCYIPYCISIVAIGYSLFANYLALYGCIIALHSARTISIFCMIYATESKIAFAYPYAFALSVLRTSCIAIALLILTL